MRGLGIMFAMLLVNVVHAQGTAPISTLETCMRNVLACLSGCNNESTCLVACKSGLDRCVNSVPNDAKQPYERLPKGDGAQALPK
jgi:hypothetical protein